MGYKDQKKKITQKGASVDLGAIPMEPDAVMLKDVVITSSIAVARKTPVAVSTVDPVFIEDKIGFSGVTANLEIYSGCLCF